MLTKLEAVNRLLGRIRERPLASLDEPMHGDTLVALDVIDQVSRRVQQRGLPFNTATAGTLPLLLDGTCPVPTGTVKVNEAVTLRSRRKALLRGERMYNAEDQTYVFDEPVVYDWLVRILPWEELPPIVQEYITAMSEVEFAVRSQADPVAIQAAQQALPASEREFMREYILGFGPNLLDHPEVDLIAARNKWAR
jgi:hypothetical protein